MKKYLIFSLLLIVACGPTEEEIQNQINDALENQRIENEKSTELAVNEALKIAQEENQLATEKAVEDAVFQATSTTTTVKEVDRRLSLAYTSCDLLSVKGASHSLESQSIYLDGTGEDDYLNTDVTIDDISCVIYELDVPQPIITRINNTTSLMGLVEDSFAGIYISWTYHPDNGLDLYFKLEE
jgi:hypothetical protein